MIHDVGPAITTTPPGPTSRTHANIAERRQEALEELRLPPTGQGEPSRPVFAKTSAGTLRFARDPPVLVAVRLRSPTMLAAFLEALPIALGTVLATLPLVGVPLILATRQDRAAHLAFLGGWTLGIVGLGGAVIALSDLSAAEAGPPARWVVLLRLALGLGLITLGARKWMRKAGRDGDADEVPGWMLAFETMGAVRTFGLGVLLVVANPKNALLVASGALTIAAATYAPAAQLAALAGFAAAASLGVATPLILTLTMGDRAERTLVGMKGFMGRHSRTIVSVVLLVLGVMVVVNAVAEL